MEPFRPNPNLKLMEQVTQVLRYHHYAKTTQKSYCSWIRHYIGFHKNRHPNEMGKAEIEQFLSYLAQTREVSASTQKQALNAIVFLYKRVLFIPVDDSLELVRAKKRVRIPVVLTQAEVQDVLFNMQGSYRMMGRLMYGLTLWQAWSRATPVSECDHPEERGVEHSQPGVQGITPWPPEAI